MDRKSDNIQAENMPKNQPTDSANYAANFPDSRREFVRPEHKHRPKFFVFFLIIGVGILGLSFSYIYGGIKDSVGYSVPDFISDQLNNEEQELQNIADLKVSDSDQDGLTDYQELYQYQTSMFLPDTDSDGYSDYEEATSGNDPLCPSGQSCSLLALITPRTKLAEVVGDIGLNQDTTFEDAVAAEFRQFLLDNGVGQEELDKLSDQDLLFLFDTVEASGILDQEQLNASTTPEQLRNFLLVQPDVNQEVINQLSDEELLDIIDQILEQ